MEKIKNQQLMADVEKVGLVEKIEGETSTDVSNQNRRLEKLKKYTDDDMLLSAVDHVAFTQEELQGLLDKGVKKIYLCQEQFEIPNMEGITYIGVNHPAASVPEGFGAKGIVIQNVDIGIEGILASAEKHVSEQNYAEAAKLWEIAAAMGNAEAQYKIGECYYYGNDVEEDYEEACKWYRKAAEQGNSDAQFMLGECYYNGDGVALDYDEAYKWYGKAAGQGHEDAKDMLELYYCEIGDRYYHGTDVAQDYKEACKWYRKAAEQGDSCAQYDLAICYYYGNGVAQDYDEAYKWFGRAAEQGDEDAKNMIGAFFAERQDMAQDNKENSRQNKKAAEQGNKEAIPEKSIRKEFEAYVENCKKFLDLLRRMPKSWNAKNGELNTHEGRMQYSEFMNNLVDNLDAESYFANILYDNMRNLYSFAQIMFSRYNELRITEIYMDGNPDYGLKFKVSSNLSIAWNENESNTLKKELEKNICEPLMSLDFSLERMETNSLAELYSACQGFSMFGGRLGTYQCLFKQFFDSLLKKLDKDNKMLDEVIALSKQHPIVYSKDLETAFIWEYKFKGPYIEIEIPYPNLMEEYQNKKSKHYSPVLLKDYETTIILIHFRNMPMSNYTARFNVEKNEYFSFEDYNTYIYANVEWGNWVSKDVIELKITKNNDNNMGTLIIKITVDEVESAVAIIESSLIP